MDLKKETQKNLLIVFGLNTFDKVIIFLGLIALARLLRPEDFGILAVSEILIGFFGVFNEHVFETSAIAISGKGNFEKTLNVAFIARIALSCLLYVLLYLISGYWARLYDNPSLAAAARVLGLTLIIDNFHFIPKTALVKERQFDKLIAPNMLRNILIYGISILLAITGFGFWSLILSRLVCYVILTVPYYIIRPWKISFSWDNKIFIAMLGYIKMMYVYMFLAFFISQIDRFVISKVLGVAVVGYYALAYGFGNWVINNVFAVFDRVAFPLYSEIKDDVALLKAVYLKFFNYILFFSVPILTGFVLFAEDFVLIFLGAKWSGAIIPLRILCFAGFFGLIGNVSNSLLKGINRLDIDVRRNLVLSLALLITIIPLTIRYGLTGSCTAVLVSSVLVQPLYFIYAIKTIKIEKQRILRTIAAILASSLFGAVFYISCDRLFLYNIQWMFGKFALSILTYMAAYLAISFILMRNEFLADIRILFKR